MDSLNGLYQSKKVNVCNMPEPITTSYREHIANLLGIDAGNIVNELGNAMKASLLTDTELTSAIYLIGVQSLQRCLQLLTRTATNNGKTLAEADPHKVFEMADRLKADVETEFGDRLRQQLNGYLSKIPPRITTRVFVPIGFRPGGKYRLTSDERNTGAIHVLLKGETLTLLPGQGLDLTGVDMLEVSAHEVQVMKWERIGGECRTGTMCGILPLPRRGVAVQSVVPEAVEQPSAPKKGWLAWLRGAK